MRHPDQRWISQDTIAFTGKSNEIQQIFAQVAPYTKLTSTITTVPVSDPDVNVEICPGEENYILYKPEWLLNLYYQSKENRWALFGVIAHEIGHFVLNHDRTSRGSNPEDEKAADAFAGEVLAKMGADLKEAQSAYRTNIIEVNNDQTHPPINERLAAVRSGWEKGREKNADSSSRERTSSARNAEFKTVKMGNTGYITGLNGRLNPILDTHGRTYLYAENIAIAGGKVQPVAFTLNQPFSVEDSLGNEFELLISEIDSNSATIQYRSLAGTEPRDRTTLTVEVKDQNARPVRGADILALFADGTHLKGVTDSKGMARIPNLKRKIVQVYCAHPNFTAFYQASCETDAKLTIDLSAKASTGSIIITGTGYIQGFAGRLNPILDSLDRMYLYAADSLIENRQAQPVTFRLEQPIQVQDQNGKRLELNFIAFISDAALIEYTQLN